MYKRVSFVIAMLLIFGSQVAFTSAEVISGGDPTFQDRLVNWKITNTGSTRVTISSIFISWPSTNGYLKRVKVNTATIFDQRQSPPSTVIESGWKGKIKNRQIPPGGTKRLSFEFEKNVATAGYKIAVKFAEGYAVQFPKEEIQDYVVLKAQFQTHTSYSGTGNSPSQVVMLYKEAGYDVIAITDYNTLAGAPEAREKAEEVGLIVIAGQEIVASFPSENRKERWKHVVALWTGTLVPSAWGVEVRPIFDAIHAQGGLGIVAHPWALNSIEQVVSFEQSPWYPFVGELYIDGWEVGSWGRGLTSDEIAYLLNNNSTIFFNHDFNEGYLSQNEYTLLFCHNGTEAAVREALESNRLVAYVKGEVYGTPEAIQLYKLHKSTINLFANPSFEDGPVESPERWTKDQVGTNIGNHLYPVLDAYDGSYSAGVKITSFSSGAMVWWQSLWGKTNPGMTYEMRCTYKVDATSRMFVNIFDTNYTLIDRKLFNLTLSDVWTRSQEYQFTLPANALYIVCGFSLRGVGALYIDMVELYELIDTG